MADLPNGVCTMANVKKTGIGDIGPQSESNNPCGVYNNEHDVQKSRERLQLLSEAAASLLVSDDPDSLIQSLAGKVMDHLGCDVFINYITIPGEHAPKLNVHAGLREEEVRDIDRIVSGQAICGSVEQSGEAVVIQDIPKQAGPWAEVLSPYGILAYACIPLLSHRGNLLGTISFGTRSRPCFARDEIDLMETVANQIATALERNRTEEALLKSQEDFKRAQTMAQTGSWRLNMHHNELLWSDETYRMFGIPLGTPLTYDLFLATVHPEDRQYVDTKWNNALAGEGYDIEHRIVVGNSVKWVREQAELEFDEQGHLLGGFGVVQDITMRKHAEEALRDNEERFRKSVDNLLDAFAISTAVRDESGKITDFEITFINLAARDMFGLTWDALVGKRVSELFRAVRTTGLFDAWVKVVETGEPCVIDDLSYEDEVLGHRISFTVDLRATRLGDGVAVAWRDVTERKRIEMEREHIYEREHRIAQALQQALVPPNVPTEIGNYRIAVRYRSALKESEVGGDFYDIFELDRSRIAVLIGDVAGKGLGAAIRVAAARYSIRGYAYLDPRPGRVLDLANDSLCKEQMEEAGMLTAFLAILNTQLGSITYASAGHEPPLVLGAGDVIEELYADGIPLGILPDQTYEERSRRLDGGDRIIMVTDGITEARAQGSVLFGRSGVLECVEQTKNNSPEDTADCLLDKATRHAGGQLQDDAAIVVIDRAVQDQERR